MEYYPVVEDGVAKKFVAIVNDVMKVVGFKTLRYYLWLDNIAIDVTTYIKANMLRIEDACIDLNELFDTKPWLYAYTFNSVDEYASFILRYVEEPLKNRKVLLAYSGGKDSSVALLTLLKLMNRIDFDLSVVYVHMPYIEPLENVQFVEYVRKKLDVDITIIEPNRAEVRYELMQSGLPLRGSRLCTYIKVAPIRLMKKLRGIDYLAYGDRIWEAGKRFERLFFRIFVNKIFVSKKLGFSVCAPLTLLDVVNIVKKNDLVHPLYLQGVQRIACKYCPYKPVYEFYVVKQRIEDEGFVEEVMKKEWLKYYKDKDISYEDFQRYHLWRFIPSLAKALLKIKRRLEKEVDRHDIIKAHEIVKMLSSIWISNVSAPRIDILRFAEVILSSIKSRDIYSGEQS